MTSLLLFFPRASRGPGLVARLFSARWLAAGLLLLAGAVAGAAADTRNLTITAPKSAMTGSPVSIMIAASTTTGGDETIQFFHAEYSLDSGKTWVPFCYQERPGARATRKTTVVAGPGGSKIIVRARIAFRGGKAGDVDYQGNPIDWDGSWTQWDTPPAKTATIEVEAQ